MYPTNDPLKYGRVSFLGLYYSFKQAPRTIAVPEKQRPQLSGSPSRKKEGLGQPFWTPRWSDGGQSPIFAGRPAVSPTGSGIGGGEKRPSFLQGFKKTRCFPLVWCKFFFSSFRSFSSLFHLSRACERSAREEALKRGFPPSHKNPARPANPRAALPGNGRSQRRKSPPTFTFLADATEPSPNLARQAPKFGERKRNAAPAPFFPRRLPLSPRSSCRSSLFPCLKCPKSGWGTACCCRRRRYICSAKGNHMATATASLRRAARELLTTLVVTRSSQRGAQRLSALPLDMPPATPVTKKSYVNGPSDIPLISKTVDQCLEETTDRYPEREALVFLTEGIRKTFSQFKQDVEQAATGLLALGLKKGDRLGMWGPNNYEWVLMQFATAQTGIILVCVNPAYQSQEVEFVLKKVGCKALVFPAQFKTQKYYEILKNVCPELEHSNPGGLKNKKLPELSVIICVDGKLPGTFSMQEVMQAGESSHKKELQEIRKMLTNKEPINIQFTSGTTGSPKGATLSHCNILNNANFIGIRLGLHELEARCCVPVPLYHCLGSVGGCMVMAVHGVSLIFPCLSFNSKASLKAIEHEKCTHLLGTPTMYIDMLGQPDFASYDLSSLRGGAIGGSTVPPEIMKKIIQKMNIRDIVGVYGTTENSPVTFMGFPQDNFAQKTETVGYILPHTEAKIEDPNTGQLVPLNSAGELQIRGYCVMLGYWADTNKTKEVLNDEQWYKTGDIAILDEYGYCKIVGRCKDMIIRGGENIYPAELEQFLHTHPKIQEVQVVGIKDERLGEEICASIRLKAGEECTADEIKAFCKGKIAYFKIPRYVVFVKDYPLTVSGKIQKYKLRERMEKHLQLQ